MFKALSSKNLFTHSLSSRRKAIVVEYEYHYGFLLLMIKLLAEADYLTDVYCNTRFVEFYIKHAEPHENINLISKYSVSKGTVHAIRNSKLCDIFVHFSVQAHPISTILRLLKPKARKNILYTPRPSNWHNQKFSISFFKRDIINNYFNVFRFFIKKNYEYFIVHSEQMARDITARKHLKVISIPYTIRPNTGVGDVEDCQNDQKLRVTILGSIDETRRDYLSVFSYKSLKQHDFSNVVFELAGVPNGSNFKTKDVLNPYFEIIKSECAKIAEATGCSFFYYSERLNDQEYEDAIKRADVLLMPLNLNNYPLGGWSAGLAESIENDKRVIIPAEYKVPNGYPNDYFKYKDTLELSGVIKCLALNKTLCKLNLEELAKRKKEFSLDAVSSRFFNSLAEKDTIA